VPLAGTGLDAQRADAPEGGRVRLDVDHVYPPVLGVITRRILEPALGAPYLTTARWLREFDRWPDQRRREWQEQRRTDIVRHALSSVPFYRERFPGHTALELSQLPVVDKALIRPAMPMFLSEGWETMRSIEKRTGGTTGDPWRYPLGKEGWTQIYAAALRFREDLGYRYGDRMILVGTPLSLTPGGTSWKTALRYRLERRVSAAAGLEVDHEASLQRARLAESARAALWYGYAGTLAAMAAAVLREGISVRPPKAILSTSEVLLPEWRSQIEEAFGVRVADEYGCNDGGVLAQSCPANRFHVADSLSIVEVLDEHDQPCPAGREGAVTVTNLHTKVLPFLRYRVGDRAVIGADHCPCGRPGTTLLRIAGRQGDRVVLPDGRQLSALAFGAVFKRCPNVRLWQVVQEAPGRLKVRMELDAPLTQEETQTLRSYFRDRCGEQVTVSLTVAESIPRTPAGKHRVVLRLDELGSASGQGK